MAYIGDILISLSPDGEQQKYGLFAWSRALDIHDPVLRNFGGCDKGFAKRQYGIAVTIQRHPQDIRA